VYRSQKSEEVRMRKGALPFATAGLLVAMALPAQAKVAGEAYISGPGLPGGGISVDGSDGGGWPVESGLLNGELVEETAPPGELGPRYRVTYVIAEPPGQPDVIQHLYPYADGGPVVYTPGGQQWLGATAGDAPAGWFAADQGLTDLLTEAGLPSTAPAVERAPAPRTEPSAALPWAIAGLAALLLAGTAAGLRRVRPALQRTALR
jgi:hypothetical protein